MNSRENRRRAGLLLLMIGAIVFLSNVVLVTAEARYLDVVAGLLAGLGLTLWLFPDVRTP